MESKYNIGAGDAPIEGWHNLDIGDDIYLDELPCADTIYTSHFLEYFDKSGVMALLQAWYKSLKQGGKLYISVPDFAQITKIYSEQGIILDGPLFGKMEPGIYHKCVFDKKTLREAMYLAGFKKVKEFVPFHEDCSQDPISLNLQCLK